MGVGLVRSLQTPDILWIHWWVYNFIANTSKWVLFLPPFWCLCQKLSLSPLYFNKTLLHTHTQKFLIQNSSDKLTKRSTICELFGSLGSFQLLILNFEDVHKANIILSRHNLTAVDISQGSEWVSEVPQSCRLFATSWTVAYQAPLSMGFSRQEYWSGLPFPSPGDLPNPGIKPRSPTM